MHPGSYRIPTTSRRTGDRPTYDVRNLAVISAVYDLPFGKGKAFAGGLVDRLCRRTGQRMVGEQHRRCCRADFPSRRSSATTLRTTATRATRCGRSSNPDFHGSIITGNPNQWFNPAAFLQPPANSGFFGNLGRNTLIGPGLATWDFSAVKDTTLHERLSLQFRAEIFNLLNRANFNTPNLIVFTPSGVSGTAGAITSTSTTARQVQFGAKLLW